jgi:Zn finger protein HypA/HybF involved in hydrogenase expression
MIQPKPFKYKCPKCGYTKVVKPKSDALNPIDILMTCPKCKSDMDKVDLSFFDKLLV